MTKVQLGSSGPSPIHPEVNGLESTSHALSIRKSAGLLPTSATSRTPSGVSSDLRSVSFNTVSLAALDLATTQPKTRVSAGLHRELLGSLSGESADAIKQHPHLENDLNVDRKFNDKTLVSFQSDLALAAISHVSGNSKTAQDIQSLVREVTRSIVIDIEENGLTPDAEKSLGFLKKQLPPTLQELKDQPLGEHFDLSLHLYFQAEVGYQSKAVATHYLEEHKEVLSQQDGSRKHVGKYWGESEGIKRLPYTKELGIGLDENKYRTIFPELRSEEKSHFSGSRIWHITKPIENQPNISGPSGTAFHTLAAAEHHLSKLEEPSPDHINIYKSLVIANIVNQGHHSIEEAVQTTQNFGNPIPITDEGKVRFSDLLHPAFVEGNTRIDQVKTAYPDFFK